MVALRTEFAKRRAEERISDVVEAYEPYLQRIFLGAVAAIKSRLHLNALAEMLEAGRIDAALAIVSEEIAALAAGAHDAFEAAAKQTAAYINRHVSVRVDFDRVNERAVRVIRERKLTTIAEFTAEQTRATHTALVEGMRTGANPRAQARAFRDSIGLTERQMAHVRNFRRLLEQGSSEALTRALRDKRFDRTIRAAVRANGRALTREQVDRMVERYEQRYLKFRAETIAQTEALGAVHQGSEEAMQQAIDAGTIDPARLQSKWLHNARRKHFRKDHLFMHGQLRPWGVPFLSGSGVTLRYPGDPDAPASEVVRCGCTKTTRILPQGQSPQST